MLIKNGLVFTDKGCLEQLTIITAGGRIKSIFSGSTSAGRDQTQVVDASGCFVLPGLCDIHFHGGGGTELSAGTIDTFDRLAKFEFSHGVTVMCPATLTMPDDKLCSVLRAAVEYRERQRLGHATQGRAVLAGMHLEGPFVSREKRGALSEEYICSPDTGLLKRWLSEGGGLVKLVTLAPELPGALDCVRELKEKVHFSAGHTMCDYFTAMSAFEAGVDHVTHLYNAMLPLSHREPGLIGAAFDCEDCFAELICDGIHISPSAVRAAFRLFDGDRIVMISDSMSAAGMPDGEYKLGDAQVHVKNRRVTLDDGTLAGSASTLYDCFVSALKMGIPFESAAKAVTINPCRSIGIDSEFGSITAGKRAHFLLIDSRDLSIRKVIAEQEKV